MDFHHVALGQKNTGSHGVADNTIGQRIHGAGDGCQWGGHFYVSPLR
jgi:hypothetical protein